MAMTKDPDEINDEDRAADAALKDLIWKMGQSYAGRNSRSKTENEGRKKERDGMESQDIDSNAFGTVVRLVKTKSPRELKRWVDSFKLCMAVLGKAQADLFPEDAVRAQKREQDRRDKEKAARDAARTPTELDAASDTNPRSDPAKGGAGKTKTKPAAKSKGKKANSGAKAVGLDGQPVSEDQPRTAGESVTAAVKAGEAMIREGIAKNAHADAPGANPGVMKSAAEAVQQQNNPDETIEQREAKEGDATFAELMKGTNAAQAGASAPESQSAIAQRKLDEAMNPGGKPN